MKTFEEKCLDFNNIIKNIAGTDSAVAYSGGVDSSLLLKELCDAARQAGTKVYAVTISSMLNPVSEIGECKTTAEKFGAVHKVLEINSLEEAGISDNPKNRCYLCKKYMFSKLAELASVAGAKKIADGTNFDDLHTYRPGLKALEEIGVVSPIAESGLTKAEVRTLASRYGIFSADKPSAPCMATRFPYGTRLTEKEIRKAEAAEEYIKSLGFYNVRVRVHGDIARIEVDSGDIQKLSELRDGVTAFLKNLGYGYVTLDLCGFVSGSMDRP